jgi:hypothetical protein
MNTDTLIPKHKILMLSVRKAAESGKSIYDATRFAWKLDINRAKEVDVVVAHDGKKIVGVFVVDEWKNAGDPIFSSLKQNQDDDVSSRFAFIGKEAPENIVSEYLNKILPAGFTKRGAANPVRFIDPKINYHGDESSNVADFVERSTGSNEDILNDVDDIITEIKKYFPSHPDIDELIEDLNDGRFYSDTAYKFRSNKKVYKSLAMLALLSEKDISRRLNIYEEVLKIPIDKEFKDKVVAQILADFRTKKDLVSIISFFDNDEKVMPKCIKDILPDSDWDKIEIRGTGASIRICEIKDSEVKKLKDLINEKGKVDHHDLGDIVEQFGYDVSILEYPFVTDISILHNDCDTKFLSKENYIENFDKDKHMLFGEGNDPPYDFAESENSSKKNSSKKHMVVFYLKKGNWFTASGQNADFDLDKLKLVTQKLEIGNRAVSPLYSIEYDGTAFVDCEGLDFEYLDEKEDIGFGVVVLENGTSTDLFMNDSILAYFNQHSDHEIDSNKSGIFTNDPSEYADKAKDLVKSDPGLADKLFLNALSLINKNTYQNSNYWDTVPDAIYDIERYYRVISDESIKLSSLRIGLTAILNSLGKGLFGDDYVISILAGLDGYSDNSKDPFRQAVINALILNAKESKMASACYLTAKQISSFYSEQVEINGEDYAKINFDMSVLESLLTTAIELCDSNDTEDAFWLRDAVDEIFRYIIPEFEPLRDSILAKIPDAD